jgi:hypothetical protein
MRGLSATELFLAAVEPAATDRLPEPGPGSEACVTRPLVLYWDGAFFHWI